MAAIATFHSFGPFFVNGNLVAAPHVYHYIAGTSTLLNAYTDRAKITTAAQPLVGDANGIASAFFDGLYKIVIKTSDETTTLATYDNMELLSAVSQSDAAVYVDYANVGGTADAILLTPATPIVAYEDGQTFRFVSRYANTGATTVAISGLAAETISKSGHSGNMILYAGDIPSSTVVQITRYGGLWFLTPVSAPQEVNWTPSVGGNTTYTSRQGRAMRDGMRVNINCSIAINVLGTGSTIQISGVPYSCYGYATGAVYVNGAASNVVSVVADLSGSTITLNSLLAAGSTMSANNIFTNGTVVRFSLDYLTLDA